MTNSAGLTDVSVKPLDSFQSDHPHYALVEQIICFLVKNSAQQPSLATLSAHFGLSEYYLQRVFSLWAGLTPKQFLQFVLSQNAKHLLHTQSVQTVSLELGLSSASRLHDLMVRVDGMTPGDYKRDGEYLDIVWGVGQSEFGLALAATSNRGICHLAFINDLGAIDAESSMFKAQWARAQLTRDDSATQVLLDNVLGAQQDLGMKPLNLLLKGTPFQIKVWQALLTCPQSSVMTYGELAQSIDHAKGVRAVASAVARNNIAYLIPCHRVIRGTGLVNQYRWGMERKMAMLLREGARHTP